MAKISKIFHLDVTPQKFIDACDESELHEVILLANKSLDALERNSKGRVPRMRNPPPPPAKILEFSKSIECVEKCDCPTAACRKHCNKDCDEN